MGRKLRRNLLAIVMAAILCFNLSGCGGNNDSQSAEASFDEQAALKGMATEVTGSLAELIACDDYLKAMSTSQDLIGVIEEWRALEIDQSKPIYVITLDNRDVENYLNRMSGDESDLSGMPESVREYLFGRVGDSMGNILNGKMGGVSVLAASAIARYAKTFVPEGAVENQVWIIPCNEEMAVCVSFSNTGNGVLTVTATYVVFNLEMSNILFEQGGLPLKKIDW